MSSIVVTILFFVAVVAKGGHAAYNETAFLALKAQVAGIHMIKKLFIDEGK